MRTSKSAFLVLLLAFASTTAYAAAPTAATNAATSVTYTTATLNGTVDPNKNTTTVTFQYGLTAPGYGTTVSATPSPISGNSNTSVSAGLTGLTCNTTYHFRVVAAYGSNTVNGSDLSFTTTACAAPTAATTAATALTGTTAQLNGTVSSNGAVTTVGFQYGATTAYGTTVTASESPLPTGASGSAVSFPLTGLTCGNTYNYRVYANNGIGGTIYGGNQTFTLPCAPTAVTGAASGVTATGATLSGTISSNGATTSTFFQYGTTTGYGTEVAASPASLGATAVSNISATLTGLACNTTYHFRAHGDNAAGAGYGNDATFTTPLCPVTLGKTISTAAAAVGSYVTFNLTATNLNGATALDNVVVTDVIPTGMSYNTHVATLGTASVSGQTLTWTIRSLPPGTSAELTLVVLLNTKGTFTNTVSSSGATSASATILVLPSAITHYRLDEPVGSWTGKDGEVIDSGGNSLNGHRRPATASGTNTVLPGTTTLPGTTSPTPTIASQQSSVVGGFCNAGYFDGNGVVESAKSDFFQFKQTLSASVWVYPTAYPSSDLYSILSNDVNYEFHLDTGGHLFWWWQASTLTSAATIPKNKWTHIAITMDAAAGRERIYINGVQDSSTNNWKGTLATNNCPFYIGGDIYTDGNCTLATGRNFHGMIDEAKIYNYELSADEVKADMNLGRLCSGTFDHIQIEHDGTASTCSPKTVTLKACLDSACTALYPGSVTVQLSPSGWTPSDIVTINGGVATATLNNSSIVPPTLTLGTVSVTPTPANATRCFNDATETCSLSVATATSCNADAVEVGAAPRTNILTKLAGTTFSVDLLALLNGTTTLDTAFAGTMVYDLVDTSSAACSGTSTALNAAQSYSFNKNGDGGRKTVSMSSATAAKSVQVRIKTGTSYACSTDKFSIRPSAVTLTSTNANAYASDLKLTGTAPNPAATPVVRAGGAFNLGATATPSSYAGVMALGPAPLTAQLPLVGTAPESGGTVGTLTFDPLTVNASPAGTAKYSEVGYLYAGAGSFSDTGSFTAVDHNATCAKDNSCDCWMPTYDKDGNLNVNDTNYLSDTAVSGKYGCYVGNKVGFVFGRFIPDHFSTMATGPMACPADLTCAAGGLAYSGQPLNPLTITAMAAGESTTRNYANSFARNVTLSAWDANGSTATNRTATPGVLTPVAVSASDFASGAATKTAAASPAAYTFGTVPTKPTDIYIRAVENSQVGLDSSQLVSSLRSPANTSLEGGVTVVSGRLKISNATGSEKRELRVPVEVDFWSGLAWVQNDKDTGTAFTKDSVLLVQPPTWNPPISATVESVSAGKWNLVLSPPGQAGSVDLAIDLGTTAPDNSCLTTHGNGLTAVGAPWLRGTWCSAIAAGQADPSARATFGIYTPENRRTIFIRELY